MGYLLNSDMWHVVNPEDQKIHRLSRGDKVPEWALPEGDDLKAVTDPSLARIPLFVKDEEDVTSSPGTEPAKDLSVARSESPSPKQADKK